MKEILIFGNGKVYVRRLTVDSDEFNLFPRHPYTEREATREDIERIAPGLLTSDSVS